MDKTYLNVLCIARNCLMISKSRRDYLVLIGAFVLLLLKDDIYDSFVQNDRYVNGQCYDVPRRPNDLIIWALWSIALSIPLFYFAGMVFLQGSVFLQLTTLALLFGGQSL